LNTWIFAGLCDKSDTLMHICKLLASGGSSVLLVDASEKRRYPYFIGGLGEKLCITEFAGFDVACGFGDSAGLKAYFRSHGGALEHYDYVLYDLELPDFCAKEDWLSASELVWVTDYEVWTLEEGGKWLSEAVLRYFDPGVRPEMKRIIVRAVEEWFGPSYLDGYFERLPVRWKGDPVVLPWNELDYSLKLRNEHAKRIHMKALTRTYKKRLCGIFETFTDWDRKQIQRALKNAERSQA